MAELNDIVKFLNEQLKMEKFPSDYSNNGVQFEGNREVSKAVFAVDASQALFTIAADLDADLVFVHHGISWGNSLKRITGMTARRISILAANSISLFAAHLPLDAHPKFGHNALLAEIADLFEPVPFCKYADQKIGIQGKLKHPITLEKLAGLFDKKLASSGEIRIFGDPKKEVFQAGIVSGSGCSALEEAGELGIDCLITGEMGHTAYHTALENDVSILALGHYRSETPGVLAVMELVRKQFGIETEFIDLPTNM